MSEELEVLKIVTGRLNEAQVPYMLTGSIAANFYAVPRLTRDIDIVVELRTVDVEKVFSLFAGDFYIDKGMIWEAITQQRMFNIIHEKAIVKVDLIIKKDDQYQRQAFARRRKVDIEGIEMFIIAPEDLILSKLLWAKQNLSELQLADVRNLLSSLTELDHVYLSRWAKELAVEDLYREAAK